MKYIRTKDGIFQLEGTYEHLGKTYYCVKEFISSFYESEVLNQADTIEELCDEFVIISIDQNKKPITHFTRHVNEPISVFALDSHIIYGTIWTEWGLKYIAKMNEKGELELI